MKKKVGQKAIINRIKKAYPEYELSDKAIRALLEGEGIAYFDRIKAEYVGFDKYEIEE